MIRFRERSNRCLVIVVCLFTFTTLLTGCAVLTPTQIREVNKFANAAHSYSTLPGAVIDAHSDIRITQKMLEASTFKDGKNSLEQIKSALSAQEQFRKRSKKADQSLDILTGYADLLKKLTSDDYTNELQASAEDLGKTIDNGIAVYNKDHSTDFSVFGAATAAIVRGAGGIYIKNRQSKALKHAITTAEPAIDDMISSVEALLALYLGEKDIKGLKTGSNKPLTMDLIRNAREDLEESYKHAVKLHEGRLPLDTALIVADELTAVDDAVELARNSLRAAEAFRKAHTKLAGIIRQKQSLTGIVEEIQVLSDEVREARKLRDKLNK